MREKVMGREGRGREGRGRRQLHLHLNCPEAEAEGGQSPVRPVLPHSRDYRGKGSPSRGGEGGTHLYGPFSPVMFIEGCMLPRAELPSRPLSRLLLSTRALISDPLPDLQVGGEGGVLAHWLLASKLLPEP